MEQAATIKDLMRLQKETLDAINVVSVEIAKLKVKVMMISGGVSFVMSAVVVIVAAWIKKG